jgi:hypothetical protein
MSGDRTGPTGASPNGTGSKGPNGTGKGLGPDVVVFGQIARDLVLVVDTMPGDWLNA